MNRYRLAEYLVGTILISAVASVLPCLGGTNTWTIAGAPWGGTVNAIVVNPQSPSTLYAVSGPGIYETSNSGADWNLVLSLPLNQASDIAIEPENPTTLYVATQGGGIYKTTDGGTTWTSVNTGIPTQSGQTVPVSIYRIAVDPVTDGVAYAVTLTDGVYKTTNGGQSWSAINNGISQLLFNGSQINRLVVDPANSQILYLVDNVFTGPNTSVAGVYKSTDGGTTWTASLTGVSCWDIAVNPQNDLDLYVASNSGILATSNSGGTWGTLTTNTPAPDVISLDPSNPKNLYVGTFYNGVYVSKDGGSTWSQSIAGNATYITGFVIDPASPSSIYVSSITWGVLASANGGSTWTDANTGIGNVGINEMLMGGDGAIYIGANGAGIYKSIDQGVTWSVMDNGITSAPGLTGITVYALAEDPATATTLFAGTVDGLFKTVDGGSNWTLLNNGITDPYTMSVAIDPENTATVYAGTQSKGVFKSVDAGTSWSSINSGITDIDILSLAVNPANSMIVYAGGQANGLFVSNNGGSSWATANTGMPVTGVWAIAVDPKTPTTMYVSLTNQDIYKSTDGGNTWSNSSSGLPPGFIFTTIQIDPQNTSTLYVTGIAGTGVYVSTDGGANWNPLASGLPAAIKHAALSRAALIGGAQPMSTSDPVTLNTVVINPIQPATLFAGASDHNVYTYSVPAAPTASSGSITTTEGVAVSGTLAATGAGPLTFHVVTQPANGAVTVTNASTGAFTYTPASGYSGTDSFTFNASNSGGTSNTASESVTVTASGRGGGGGNSGGSSGGGGGFSVLGLLALLGAETLRRKRGPC